METLSAENLMTSDNPILYRILQFLDFFSLEAYSLAIVDTKLWHLLNISFDLDRKLRPWTHNTSKKQHPLKLYWKYDTYDIEDSLWDNQTCKCKYCSEVICCTHDWYGECVCDVCDCQLYHCWWILPQRRWWTKPMVVTSDYRKVITKILDYRKQYNHPYTRSHVQRSSSSRRIIRYSLPKCQSLCRGLNV